MIIEKEIIDVIKKFNERELDKASISIQFKNEIDEHYYYGSKAYTVLLNDNNNIGKIRMDKIYNKIYFYPNKDIPYTMEQLYIIISFMSEIE